MWATPNDVAVRWRLLSQAEIDTAAVLIEDAEDMILARWPDIETRLELGEVRAGSLRRAVSNMVKRAMIAGESGGISQQAQTAGPFTVSNTYSNPNGNLYLTKDEIALLGGNQARRAFSVDLGPSSLPRGY